VRVIRVVGDGVLIMLEEAKAALIEHDKAEKGGLSCNSFISALDMYKANK
jgi:hypothetical protein